MTEKLEVSYSTEIDLGEISYGDDPINLVIAKNSINRGAMQKLSELKDLLDFLEDKPMNTIDSLKHQAQVRE